MFRKPGGDSEDTARSDWPESAFTFEIDVIPTIGQQNPHLEWQDIRSSTWPTYFAWWSKDKTSFPHFERWAEAHRVVHAFWNLDTRIWQTYAQRDLIGVEPTIPFCIEQMQLAANAKRALEVDDAFDFAWQVHNYQERRRLWDEWTTSEYTGWAPTRRPFQLPEHKGFKQLAIIYDKSKQHTEAIKVCRDALAVGWPGDWEVRVARYTKRLERLANAQSKTSKRARAGTPPPAFCEHCGTPFGENDRFCGNCGDPR